MPALDREHSTLLVIDIQGRLMPAIEDGPAVIANARRLVEAAELLEIPVLFTEQNPAGLGPTVPELTPPGPVAHKMTFDAVRSPGFLDRLPAERAIVVAGCEAHVCVLQTVLGLLAHRGLSLLHWQSPSVEAAADHGLVAHHRHLAQGSTAVVHCLLPTEPTPLLDQLEVPISRRRRRLGRVARHCC